uniref:PX domain-containing protein n=1 Tax=Romanomermis culicivorax TaxID=13658 RepID=A0A915HH63_ROMCU
MIHITIPETVKIYDNNGNVHDGFKVHINGILHCTLRYSALLNLHDDLRKLFEWVEVIGFPPKKIKFLMTDKELDERRELLEFYLRTICQNPQTSAHSIVTNFFRESQKDCFLSQNSEDIDIHVAIYLLDGSKTLIHCSPGEPTSMILQRLCEKLKIGSQFMKYFGLFIAGKSDINPYKSKQPISLFLFDNFDIGYRLVVRWLQDFECPLISLLTLNQLSPKKSLKIILRKWYYWNVEIDKELLNDDNALRLIYIQACCELESWKKLQNINVEASNSKWSTPNVDFFNKCKELQDANLKKDLVKACQVQPHYGLLYFENCFSDYPRSKTEVRLAFGNKHLQILYKVPETDSFVETAFRVNRIRCWKLLSKDDDGVPRLSIEYLVARDHLEWINFYSEQSVLLSLCLQSMVNEIVQSRNTTEVPKRFSRDSPISSPSSQNSNGTANSKSVASSTNCSSTTSSYESFSNMPSPTPVVRLSKTKKLSSSFDNEAFNAITDQDL